MIWKPNHFNLTGARPTPTRNSPPQGRTVRPARVRKNHAKIEHFILAFLCFFYFPLVQGGTPTPNTVLTYRGPHGETVFSDRHIYRRGYTPDNHHHVKYETYRTYKKKYHASEWDQFILHSAKRFNVEASLIKAVIAAESNFDPYAKSSAGAMGLMQLMPLTCKEYQVTHPYHPQKNIIAGTKHLKYLLKKYGNIRLALAAYNAGESNVRKYQGVPPFPETQHYIKKVLKLSQQYAAFR